MDEYSEITRLLLEAYIKVLLVDLKTDSFKEVKVDGDEVNTEHGYSDKLSEWLLGFANAGNVHPDDLHDYLIFAKIPALMKALDEGRESVSVRYRRRMGKRFRWVRMTVRKGNGYSPDDASAMLFIQDIHDDVLAQQKISEQKNITQALVDIYFTCLYVNVDDSSYTRIHVAPGFEEWVPETGNMVDVMTAYLDRLAIPVERDSFMENFSTATIFDKLRRQRSYDYEYRATTESGKELWCRIYAVIVDSHADGTPHHIIIAMQDTTAQAESVARTNAMLKDAFSTATAASSAKSEFMSRMSHDIRTPLNGIIGMTAIAGVHLDDDKRVADCLGKITNASKHLLALINDILDLSKIESGKIDLDTADFNLPDLIDDLTSMVYGPAADHGHEVSIYIDNVEHENVVGDNVRLQQVFTNLVSNAIKYTPDHGKIKLTLSELPSNSPHVGHYRFVCEDNGYGMTQEFQSRLFEPFERADDLRISKTQGTGLGMTITRNIVQMMGGDIHVESEPDVGTTFTVDFKLRLLDPKSEDGADDFVDLPVLVVDDDEVTCESACITLGELGMRSEYTLDGATAVKMVTDAHERDEDYFACLIDWKMPGMDGFETTRRIRKLVGPHVPIIIISAYEWDDIEAEALRAGADGFISKPLFKSRLHAAFLELPRTNQRKPEDKGLEDFEEKDYSDKHLLLVEDNELNREIALEIMRMTGATVDAAEDGQKAVDMFKAAQPGHYDMIFMDIRMPVMDGYEATESIRALDRADAATTPIIALSANALLEDVEQAREAGMDKHMPKPIDLTKLLELMEEFLG